MRIDIKQIGKNIALARQAAGLSQEAVAIRLGISPGAVGKYERGEVKDFGVEKIEQIASACETTSFFLINNQETYEDIPPAQRGKVVRMFNPPLGAKSVNSEIGMRYKYGVEPPQKHLISDQELPSLPLSEDDYDSLVGLIDQLQEERDRLYFEIEKLTTEKKTIDITIIKQVIESVEEHLQNNQLTMTPDKIAELVEVLYEEISESGAEQVNKGTVARLIRLAT